MKRVSNCAFAATLSFVALSVATKAVATITVPTQQPTVQDAINAALPGEQIIVLPGSYNEGTINVTKSVSIEGPNIGIGPSGTRGPDARIIGGFVILADDVSIQGLQIVVWMPGSFSMRRAIHAPNAVARLDVSFNWILSPTAAPSSYNIAIDLGDQTGAVRSSDIRIRANTIFGDVPGAVQAVQINSADRAAVLDNSIVLQTATSTSGDFGWPGVVLDAARDCNIGKNAFDCGQSNVNSGSPTYGVGITAFNDESTDVVIRDNVMINGSAGILTQSTDHSIRRLTIRGNLLEGRIYGITLQSFASFMSPLSHEQVDISNNEIKMGFTGVLFAELVPPRNALFSDVEIHHNCFEPMPGAGTPHGVGLMASVVIPSNGGMVDARQNYWNAPNGPSTVGPGSGVRVSLRVDFSKWRTRCNHRD